MKKIITAAVIMSMAALFTACEEISQEPLNKTDSSAYAPTEEVTEYVEETVSFTEYVAKVPEINTTEASMTIEAEDCKLNGSLYTDEQRKGFPETDTLQAFTAVQLIILSYLPIFRRLSIIILPYALQLTAMLQAPSMLMTAISVSLLSTARMKGLYV